MKTSFCLCIDNCISERYSNDVMFIDVRQHGGDMCMRTLQRYITQKTIELASLLKQFKLFQ